MKKEIYEAPVAIVLRLDREDVIRTSGDLGEWDEKTRALGPTTNPNARD